MTRRPLSELDKSFLGIDVIEIIDVAPLNAGLGEDTPIQPPADEIWELSDLYLYVDVVPGANSGNHTFQLKDFTDDSLLEGGSSYNVPIRYEHSRWDEAVLTAEPSSAKELQHIFSRITIYNDRPIEITYFNNSNAQQTNPRTIRYVVRKWKK